MSDLVEQYFKRDLTSEEQESLGKLLLNSDEAALQFEAIAKESYLRFGFPDPKPNWGGPSGSSGPAHPPTVPGIGPWLWISAALLSAGASYLFWSAHKVSAPVNRTSVVISDRSKMKAIKEKGLPTSPEKKRGAQIHYVLAEGRDGSKLSKEATGNRVSYDSSPRVPSVGESGLPAAILKTSPNLSAGPPGGSVGMAPVNMDLNPSATYPNLSVVVSQSQLGFLTVRVLDTAGVQVKPLYQGSLGPGNWMFEWDGKEVDGRPASPGYYQIEVISGDSRQRKGIQIQ